MSLTIGQIVGFLDDWAPCAAAEDFDNTGLLLGNSETEVKGILIAHDTTETVIEEALAKNCNLVVGYHPIIFSGLKKITGRNYVEKAVGKALRNDIGVYALHTALDKQAHGTNKALADALQLTESRFLIQSSGNMGKLVTYVPVDQAEKVRSALFAAGAGSFGQYDECSFNLFGEGTFKPVEGAQPFVGQVGKRHTEKEVQVGVVFPLHLQERLIQALKAAHPYEEVAFEIYATRNPNPEVGMGMIGKLHEKMSEAAFVQHLKNTLNLKMVRHSAFTGKDISRVAVLAGSGAFAIAESKKQGADALVTADLKYHNFFEAEGQILLTDVGHYESEQFTKFLIHDYLVEKITNFAPAFSVEKIKVTEQSTNPINYA